jgi:hypothetical protein
LKIESFARHQRKDDLFRIGFIEFIKGLDSLTQFVASPLRINANGDEKAGSNERTTQTERIFNLLVGAGRRQLYLGVSEVRISLELFSMKERKKMMGNKETEAARRAKGKKEREYERRGRKLEGLEEGMSEECAWEVQRLKRGEGVEVGVVVGGRCVGREGNTMHAVQEKQQQPQKQPQE